MFHCVLTISNDMLIHKIKTAEHYFLAAVVAVVALDFADFFDVCVRFARFFVTVCVVSPVKYEVTFSNNDESDHADFFGST
jgi:hypothetical protein